MRPLVLNVKMQGHFTSRRALARLKSMQEELTGMQERAEQMSVANEASMRRKPARLEALENETGVGGASVAFQRRMDLKQRLRRLEAGAARPHFRERPKPKTNTIISSTETTLSSELSGMHTGAGLGIVQRTFGSSIIRHQ